MVVAVAVVVVVVIVALAVGTMDGVSWLRRTPSLSL